jgi:DNA polymerase-4/protein ImuB
MASGQAQRDVEVNPDGLAVACVFIPYFPLRVEILRHPELDGLPLALVELGQRRLVTQASPEAQEEGIRVGMPLRDAIAACPRAALLTADPVAYAAAAADLAQALGAVSPEVEAGELGCVYVNLRGLTRLHGGPDGVARALQAALPPTYRPRVGLAANKFTARMAAHWARPGRVRAVPAAFSKAFLANCPVQLLPVPAETQRRLERFGLYELRDVAQLPPAKLQAQFGPLGRRIWELANGLDSEPLRPPARLERVTERLPLPASSAQRETLLLGVEQLCQRLYARPELRNRGARLARLRLRLEESGSWEQTYALKGVVSSPAALFQALGGRLARLELAGAVEELILELADLSPHIPWQAELFESGMHVRQARRVNEAVAQLKSRYGASPLCRAMRVEPWSRLPERRWGLLCEAASGLGEHG